MSCPRCGCQLVKRIGSLRTHVRMELVVKIQVKCLDCGQDFIVDEIPDGCECNDDKPWNTEYK